MIKIDKIRIEEFRGVRELDITLSRNNFVVCGPNGTGKSGIVDAIEFGLTGDISRLKGQGMGNVSIRQHAPHVDFRDNPSKAKVILDIHVVATGKKFIIERTVDNYSSPKVTPDTKETCIVDPIV
ncbi:AAA family ATPase [Candidatus Nomurabacteria bacterium]|nr:AAA family ATPase [Candidatus Nomurabacteria bacterium]